MMVLPMGARDDDFEGSRKFTEVINADGTKSFQDVTEYRQQGTGFGALEYNQLCAAIMGFASCTTQVSSDRKSVTETDANGRKRVTVFGKDENGNRQITETLYDADQTMQGIKITTLSKGNKVINEEVQG